MKKSIPSIPPSVSFPLKHNASKLCDKHSIALRRLLTSNAEREREEREREKKKKEKEKKEKEKKEKEKKIKLN